ncbi:hypothetical protein MP638_000980 [Amoeboaphelidium occidentale]|nr:hypothetical protein MP638_000980 [Amoeboaphelidium occidentale]
MSSSKDSTSPTLNSSKLIGLSKVDEERMIKELKRYALSQCDELVLKYIECARSHTFKWLQCRPVSKEMNECVKKYTTEEYRDKIRLKYLERKEMMHQQEQD